MDRGMLLAGGGAKLSLLDERLRQEMRIPVHVANEPLTCVATGCGTFLEEIEAYHSVLSPG